MLKYLSNLLQKGGGCLPGWQWSAMGVFTRLDGCQISRVHIDNRRRWIAMVPGFAAGGDRRCWQALRNDDEMQKFSHPQEAMFAVESYLLRHAKA
ncbi:MAG: hypothetical protein ACYCZB_18445 [Acidiphilium sp.]